MHTSVNLMELILTEWFTKRLNFKFSNVKLGEFNFEVSIILCRIIRTQVLERGGISK